MSNKLISDSGLVTGFINHKLCQWNNPCANYIYYTRLNKRHEPSEVQFQVSLFLSHHHHHHHHQQSLYNHYSPSLIINIPMFKASSFLLNSHNGGDIPHFSDRPTFVLFPLDHLQASAKFGASSCRGGIPRTLDGLSWKILHKIWMVNLRQPFFYILDTSISGQMLTMIVIYHDQCTSVVGLSAWRNHGFADAKSLDMPRYILHLLLRMAIKEHMSNTGWLRRDSPVGLLESPKGIKIPELIINQRGFSSHCSHVQ